jgi:hypothetical protein
MDKPSRLMTLISEERRIIGQMNERDRKTNINIKPPAKNADNLDAATFSITTLGIMTLGITTLSITALA